MESGGVSLVVHEDDAPAASTAPVPAPVPSVPAAPEVVPAAPEVVPAAPEVAPAVDSEKPVILCKEYPRAAGEKPWPKNLPPKPTHPPVSIVTPTYNRRKFIPWLMECIRDQTYPKERIEWLIFDDGSDKILDVIEPYMKEFNIRYFYSDKKMNIGIKRNKLNDEARGSVIVTMDDDDYYPAERVQHAVFMLAAKKVEIVGSTRNHLYFTDDATIWGVGPYNPNHATFGTMAYTKSYVKKHRCDETVIYAEEMSFTDKYSVPLAQLDPMKVMLVMCHSENTFNKNKLRENPSDVVKKTTLKLKNFVRNAKQREFYAAA